MLEQSCAAMAMSTGFTPLILLLTFSIICKGQIPDLEYTVLEDQKPATFVANIATDSHSLLPGQNFSMLRFQLLSEGNPYASLFKLYEKTGRLETSKKIDREEVCVESVTCIMGMDIAVFKDDPNVPNNADLVKVIRLNIDLQDVNDHPPTFPSPEVALTVSETVDIGYVLSTSAATDQDYGANNSVQSYEFVTVQDVFRLVVQETSTGAPTIGIEVIRHMDYEVQNFYQLTILAKDGGFPQKSGTVIVNISVLDENDNTPEFSKSEYGTTSSENRKFGSVLLQILATDKDSDENGRVSYRFSPRISQRLKNIFNLNETTGEVVVIGVIDYEIDKRLSFPVQAFDSGKQPRSSEAMVVINVTDENDNAPQININLPPGGEEISEAAEAGRYIANVAVIDPDSGKNGSVSCQLESENFNLELLYTDMYKITLKKKLDRETQPVHNVTVFCSDDGNPKLENRTKFSIKVGDVNDNFPVFTTSSYNVSIYENNNVGDVVVIVTATDKDIGKNGQVTYSLQSDASNLFSIHPSSGSITSNVILDREKQTKITFQVTATDNGDTKHMATSSVVVTILDRNDEVPRFSKDLYVFNVQENLAPGTVVGTVFAFDNDVGRNGQIHYKVNHLFNTTFTVVQNTGQIRVEQILDREQQSVYKFTLTVQDYGDPVRESSTDIIINIDDVNDNVPEVTFPSTTNNTITIFPPKNRGTIVTKVIAKDPDEGINSQLSYFIMKGNANKMFQINNQTGLIILNLDINEDSIATYTLLLAIKDGGVPTQTTWTNLVITIGSQDNNRNLIIVIAVASVTVTLSAAMIIMICILRKQDAGKDKKDKKHFSVQKNNFINDWLKCLSTSTKEIQKSGMDKVETNKLETLSQPILPTFSSSNESTASDDNTDKGKLGKTEEEDDGFVDTLDSGRGESIRERHSSDTSNNIGQGLPVKNLSKYPTQTLYTSDTASDQQYSIAPSDAVSIPESWTQRPAQLRPSYTRNVSFDDEILRERPPIHTFSSFRENPTRLSGTDSQISTISNSNNSDLNVGLSYDSQTLQRYLRSKQPHHQRQGFLNASSAKMAQKCQLPPISSAPESYEPPVNESNFSFHPTQSHSPSYKHSISFDVPSTYSNNQTLEFHKGRSLSHSDTQSHVSRRTTNSYAINPVRLEKDIEEMLNNATDCIV